MFVWKQPSQNVQAHRYSTSRIHQTTAAGGTQKRSEPIPTTSTLGWPTANCKNQNSSNLLKLYTLSYRADPPNTRSLSKLLHSANLRVRPKPAKPLHVSHRLRERTVEIVRARNGSMIASRAGEEFHECQGRALDTGRAIPKEGTVPPNP